MRRPLTLLTILFALLSVAPAGAAQTLVIRGRGFGHGVGLSQYGAYGFAQHGVGWRDILGHYYEGTAIAPLPEPPDVRVLMQSNRGSATVTGATRAGGERLDPAARYTLAPNGTGGCVLRHGGDVVLRTSGPLDVAASGDDPVRLLGLSGDGLRNALYRGAIECFPLALGRMNVINVVALEDYVRGVVAAESPASWPQDALRAQAVVARTYAITTRAGGSLGFDQYATTQSQVYHGVAAETPATDAAVAATGDQVVTYAGKPVVTYFFSTSGGRTEDVENSFLGSPPEPWLRSVTDPYDNVSPRHRWGPIRLTLRDASARLRGVLKGSLRDIRVVKRGVSPRIVKAQIVGTRGVTTVTGPELRRRFGLYDSWATFTITGRKRSSAKTTPAAPKPPATAPAPGDPGSGGTGDPAGDGSGGLLFGR